MSIIVQSTQDRNRRIGNAVSMLRRSQALNSESEKLAITLRGQGIGSDTINTRCQSLVDEAEDLELLAKVELDAITWIHQLEVRVGEPRQLTDFAIVVNNGASKGEISWDNALVVLGFSDGDVIEIIGAEDSDTDGYYTIDTVAVGGGLITFTTILGGTDNTEDTTMMMKLIELAVP